MKTENEISATKKLVNYVTEHNETLLKQNSLIPIIQNLKVDHQFCMAEIEKYTPEKLIESFLGSLGKTAFDKNLTILKAYDFIAWEHEDEHVKSVRCTFKVDVQPMEEYTTNQIMMLKERIQKLNAS